ncbi:MAG TPA: hypothetical protein ENK28_12955 [Aliiroseovarius sp.]|nr:hypothetical protein [Aliiroseovarius sp.]
MAFLHRLAYALAIGVILNTTSEMLFYSAPPEHTNAGSLALTTLFYGVTAYAALLVAAWAGVRDWPGVFLTGCVFGWLIEGVVVDTVYSALPFTLVFTAMSWHALLSVMVGFVLVRRAASWPIQRQIGLMVLLGLGFGLWAQFWPSERGAMPPPAATFLYLLGFGVTVPLANHLLDALPARFTFHPTEALVIWGAAGLLWAAKLVTTGNLAMLMLPLVMAPTLWALRRGADKRGTVILPRRPRNPARHWLFLIAPALTFAVASTGWRLFGSLPSNAIIAVLLSAIAFVVWLYAVIRPARQT